MKRNMHNTWTWGGLKYDVQITIQFHLIYKKE